ncbi:hypothetical protein JIG36_01260 [Actinoplanes sp. LDG1-06]|uniref:Lipoprotein n=1 Tax=Paractinoplanes ovalisporus TaxID=2810368 RepID=A0ABS2A4I7_9ACTN|nr:hypothetical protein [Actinoplanes ovalisporus]MBM2614183.1 hypothetical protein [Actinoplanes ovalisporus]
MRTTPVLTTAALAGIALSLTACSAAEESPSAGTTSNAAADTTVSSAPTPAAEPTSAAVAPVEDILAGERQTLIHISEDDKDWSATYEGPIAIGDGTDDGARFRLVPAKGDQYLIEALRAREEGGRWCVRADTRDEPVSVGTVKCAENETTLFRITPTGEKDDKGRPTHVISNEKYGAVQVRNDGSALYIQELGDGGGRGNYSFVDRGPVE